MNKKIQLYSMLLILPLLTVVLASGIDDASAVPPKSYGSKNSQVCGDQLCSVKTSAKSTASDKMMEKTSNKMMEKTSNKMMEKTSNKMMEKTSNKMMEKTSNKMMEQSAEQTLKLSRANVPATIPLHKGWYNGEPVYFIITDASEQIHADTITKQQKWKVELAPLLANAPKEALSKTYLFTNGVKGDGIHGSQGEVFTSTPAQPQAYSALTSHVHVTWNNAQQAQVLDSEEAILDAERQGLVTLTELPVVINMPQIVWPGGQMLVKEDKTLNDHTPYGGGQVLDIDTENMTVTFVAHRGWGPDGRTIYYIVTDATPQMPADMMGVVSSPTSAKLIANSAAVDLFQFMNGMGGPGPMGFQPGIAAAAPGDANYSPMWRIFMIGWKDPSSAALLETIGDINAYKKMGMIDVTLARPMDSDHIVNCPFIDPFQ